MAERAEITEYCIKNGKDYNKTVKEFKVSYQQIYSWVRKYEESGIEGLKDNRGRTRIETNAVTYEMLRLENIELKEQIEALKNELIALKGEPISIQ